MSVNDKEGDEFTVESIVKLDSVDKNAELRTLISHWDGGKASLESFGWSIDVTGQKSRYKPRNILIPNIFNPENGQDPLLYVFGGRDVEEIETFLIFDRWGTQVFEQKNFQPNDPSKGWDGKFRGDLLNPAVFVYQARVRFIDGEKILYKGDITLIR